MKLLSIVIAMALSCPVLGKDEVHHLRGEPQVDGKAEAEANVIGVPEKEPARVSKPAVPAEGVGVPTKETSPENDWADGDEEDELDEFMPDDFDGDETARSFVAYRPYRPYGPYRPYRPYRPYPYYRRGGGCRRWVTCYNGFYRGIRCSGGRYCTLWR